MAPCGSSRFRARLLNPVTASSSICTFPNTGVSAPIDPATGRIPLYTASVPGHSGQDMATLRVDHDFGTLIMSYGVYHASAENIALNPVVAPFTGLGLSQTDRRNNTISVSYSHVFSSNLVNEARGGFNKQHLFTHSNTTLSSFLSSIGSPVRTLTLTARWSVRKNWIHMATSASASATPSRPLVPADAIPIVPRSEPHYLW